MRRSIATAFLGALILTIGDAQGASANPVVSFVWTSTSGSGTAGGDTIDAAAGDTLTADLFLSAMSMQGILAYGLSLRFDEDLEDELDLLGYTAVFEAPFFAFGGISTLESSGSQAGEVNTIAAGSFPPGLASGTVKIAELTFLVNAGISSDGADIVSGIFSPADGIVDSMGEVLDPLVDFGTASINGGTPQMGPPMDGLFLAGLTRSVNGMLSFRFDSADNGGTAEDIVNFGFDTDLPIVGRWTSGGMWQVGSVRVVGNTYAFRMDTDGGGEPAEATVLFGSSAIGDVPLLFDWNGDLIYDPGVAREVMVGANNTWAFLLDDGSGGGPDFPVQLFGDPDIDEPVVGYFNNDTTFDVGVIREIGSNFVLLADTNADGVPDLVYPYGNTATDDYVLGDFNNDGITDLGVVRTLAGANAFLLDTNTDALRGGGPEIFKLFGNPNTDTQIVGPWRTPPI